MKTRVLNQPMIVGSPDNPHTRTLRAALAEPMATIIVTGALETAGDKEPAAVAARVAMAAKACRAQPLRLPATAQATFQVSTSLQPKEALAILVRRAVEVEVAAVAAPRSGFAVADAPVPEALAAVAVAAPVPAVQAAVAAAEASALYCATAYRCSRTFRFDRDVVDKVVTAALADKVGTVVKAEKGPFATDHRKHPRLTGNRVTAAKAARAEVEAVVRVVAGGRASASL